MLKIKVEVNADRVDACLASLLTCSREAVKKAIKAKLVCVNGSIAKASLACFEGDVIDYPASLVAVATVNTGVHPEEMSLDIIFEDKDILVLNKASGIVVHPGVKTHEPTLVAGLLYYCPGIKDVGDENRPGIVHRLDRLTEGLMVIAKTQEALENLKTQFQEKTVEKKYYALVYGDVGWEEIVCEQPLGRHPDRRQLRWVVPGGDYANTFFRVLDRRGSSTLVEAIPSTGRTHQIRVHLAFLGCPVVGDREYSDHPKASGQILQAYFLSFKHPTSGEAVTFSIPRSFA
jgi:23S rRNA pseudouridine1911/1915/1917 synthase